MKKPAHPKRLAVLIAALVLESTTLSAQDADWDPMSSETLISLPARYMVRSLEQDFRDSSLFRQIDAANTQIRIEAQRMESLHEDANAASGDAAVDLSHQLLVSKASYLELMQNKLTLDSEALTTRVQVYKDVLERLQRDKRYAQDPVRADLVASQKAARARMEGAVAVVDQMLNDWPNERVSRYQSQYGKNLQKIAELKRAISDHEANAEPSIDGQTVSREAYVRHLLANAEAQRSIIEQEHLMLNYMARLVSLDAKALEQSLLSGPEQQYAELAADDPIRPARTADFFIE